MPMSELINRSASREQVQPWRKAKIVHLSVARTSRLFAFPPDGFWARRARIVLTMFTTSCRQIQEHSLGIVICGSGVAMIPLKTYPHTYQRWRQVHFPVGFCWLIYFQTFSARLYTSMELSYDNLDESHAYKRLQNHAHSIIASHGLTGQWRC